MESTESNFSNANGHNTKQEEVKRNCLPEVHCDTEGLQDNVQSHRDR